MGVVLNAAASEMVKAGEIYPARNLRVHARYSDRRSGAMLNLIADGLLKIRRGKRGFEYRLVTKKVPAGS